MQNTEGSKNNFKRNKKAGRLAVPGFKSSYQDTVFISVKLLSR